MFLLLSQAFTWPLLTQFFLQINDYALMFHLINIDSLHGAPCKLPTSNLDNHAKFYSKKRAAQVSFKDFQNNVYTK